MVGGSRCQGTDEARRAASLVPITPELDGRNLPLDARRRVEGRREVVGRATRGRNREVGAAMTAWGGRGYWMGAKAVVEMANGWRSES